MAKQEQIYTIPVNDAFAQEGACPLCSLANWQDDSLIEFYLGPSLMEGDHRKVTNQKGFCKSHLNKLYDSQKNRLGLGLVLHTHLQDLEKDLAEAFAKTNISEKKSSLFSKGKSWKEDIVDLAQRVKEREQTCTICDRIEETMERYKEVIFHQYQTDEDFRRRFKESQGFCLGHIAYLLEGAAKYLSKADADAFIKDLAMSHQAIFEDLIADVEWFTLKFDYRNQNEPWKNSKDALPRAIKRLVGEEKF